MYIDWDEVGEWAKVVLVVILVISGVVGTLVGVAAALNEKYCDTALADFSMPHRWGFWEGCQIEVEPGRWIPLGNWYYTEQP